MLRDLERRIQQLEASKPRSRSAVCFVAADESDEQAIARLWPAGVPANTTVTCFSWLPVDGERVMQ